MKSFLFLSIGLIACFCLHAQCMVTSSLDNGSSGTLRSIIGSCPAGNTITFASQLNSDTIYLQEQAWSYSSLGIEKEITIDGTVILPLLALHKAVLLLILKIMYLL